MLIRGRLLDISTPLVMGIINATPDSFYEASRVATGDAVEVAARHLDEGAAILDVGACSTRPGLPPVSEDEELRRLDAVLPAIRAAFPDAIISLDTFRASIVRHCARHYAIDIINDVTAGSLDPDMFATAAELHLPYVLTHGYDAHVSGASAAGNPSLTSAGNHSRTPTATQDHILAALARFFAERLTTLYDLGVADVILDPGIGFGKTPDENFAILGGLRDLIHTFPDNPWLVGLSRKRIVYETLGTTPDRALNGTTVLNTIALQAGAHILRVHDTRPAVEAVTLLSRTMNGYHPYGVQSPR